MSDSEPTRERPAETRPKSRRADPGQGATVSQDVGPEAVAAVRSLSGAAGFAGAAAPSAEALLQLQRHVGNASLGRALVQRQDAGTGTGTVTPAKPTFPFVSTRSPGTRFDSEYVPKGPVPDVGDLNITLWVNITFAPFTRALMRRPEFRGHRWTAAQMRDFAWTQAEKDTFENGFMTSVMDAWSGKHTLHLNDPGFSEYRCKVNVTVVTVDDPGIAHVKMTAQKVPSGAPKFRSFVQGDKATLDIRAPESETKDEPASGFVRQIGPFDLDKADLTPALEGQIAEVEGKMRAVQSPTQTTTLLGDDWAADFVGRGSSPGTRTHNKDLGQKRAKAVEDRIKADLARPGAPSRASSVGEEHASADPKFQRVDIKVWDVKKAFQTPTPQMTRSTAAHEAGHMFGLDDEYVEETTTGGVEPKFVGDKPSHFGDVEALMGTDAANELLVQDSGSMMSQGGEVRRGHYVYFLQSLNQLTGKRWSVE